MNTTQAKFLVLACGLAFAVLPSAFASEADDQFKLLDTDGDKRISRREHEAGAQAMFSRLDTNHDNVITIAEMEAAPGAKKPGKLKFWDKKDELSASDRIRLSDLNADGQLSREESEAGAATLFARFDTDNDGYLSKDECEKGHKLLEKHSGK